MTYRELKEKIESMPEEWLDSDIRVVGHWVPGTLAHLDETDERIFIFYDYDEVFFEHELSEEDLEDEEKFGLLADEREYFIFLDE